MEKCYPIRIKITNNINNTLGKCFEIYSILEKNKIDKSIRNLKLLK